MNAIKELRKAKNLTLKELGAMCDISESAMQRIESGIRKPSFEVLLKLGEALDCSSEVILGLRPIPAPVRVISEFEKKYEALDDYGRQVVDAVMDLELRRCNAEKVIDYGTIRRYLSRPAAGVGGLVEGEDYEDIPRTAETPREADFALVVSGDSMEPYIKDGETIYVNEAARLDDMDVGVFCVDGATYVKQYAPMYGGGLMLLSANPKREDANILIKKDSNQSVQYFGKVILKNKLPKPIYKK